MSPPGQNDLAACQVAVVGLGLLGGSLTMALRGKCARLLAVDADPEVINAALDHRVVDLASTELKEILPLADLVVLATPILSILEILEHLPEFCPQPVMVMDLGSTKTMIVQKMSGLPDRFDPIGGHPMCGKENGGFSNADASLFLNAPFALVPLNRSSKRLLSIAEQLVITVGARPLFIDPEIHDKWVASTSHLPFLVANALAAVTPEQASPLIGPGLRSTTRLAPTPWSMMGDILSTNRENIQMVLGTFLEQMHVIEKYLALNDLEGLEKLLDKGAEWYQHVMKVKS